MPFYVITGADSTNGTSRTLNTSAETKAQALEYAAKSGIYVETCVMQMSPNAAPESTPAPDPFKNYPKASLPAGAYYEWLNWGARALRMISVILFFISLTSLLSNLRLATTISQNLDGDGALWMMLSVVAPGLMGILSSIVLFVFACVALAIRDIAMNSYNKG